MAAATDEEARRQLAEIAREWRVLATGLRSWYDQRMTQNSGDVDRGGCVGLAGSGANQLAIQSFGFGQHRNAGAVEYLWIGAPYERKKDISEEGESRLSEEDESGLSEEDENGFAAEGGPVPSRER